MYRKYFVEGFRFCRKVMLFSYISLLTKKDAMCRAGHNRKARLNVEFNQIVLVLSFNLVLLYCNSFTVYYPDVYLQFNMFRAFSRPSSGTQ